MQAPRESIEIIRDFLQKCADMPDVAPVDFDVWAALERLEDCAGSYEAQHDCYQCDCGSCWNTPAQLKRHQEQCQEAA